jgi:protein arginine kinase activator
MQCQLCEKPATVHLTEIADGEKIERHLCESCAQNEGITINVQIAPPKSMPVHELLETLAAAQEEAEDIAGIQCPECDLTWSEFRKSGVLGCPNDYVAFAKPLRWLIEQAQGPDLNHVGKAPRRMAKGASKQATLRRLRQDMEAAVLQEDYEVAAGLRDQIAKLRG